MRSRSRLSLDGQWQFLHGADYADFLSSSKQSDNVNNRENWRPIAVPGPWQAQFDDLRLVAGAARYRREFQTPADWGEQSAVLHFGAVDYQTQIWLNGTFVGEHEGGYLPFEFEVAHLLAADGRNNLELYVTDPPIESSNDNPLFAEIPHGKQSWYGQLSGVWQSVWIEKRPLIHIQRVKLTPEATTGKVAVEVALNRPLGEGDTICVALISPDGEQVAEGSAVVPTLSLIVPDPQLWDIDTPNLYQAWVTLETVAGQDEVTESFGFRTIAARDGKVWLNGRPLYLRGALDQDYYPDLIYTPPSLEYIEAQFRQAKEMGLNCLRVHIKVADPRYYIAADRVGLLIWTELPNWRTLTETAKGHARQTIAGMIERDWNHPAIIIWTIINESWGMELATNAEHRAWLAEMFAWVKQLDPTRLVVDNSPCFPNVHVHSDLDDFHFYAAMPDGMERWDQWVSDFANRAPWLYGPEPEYQANREKGAPLIVSEFGNWGLPDIGPLVDHYQGDPWWFGTGDNWSGGDVHPEGAADRFHALHLDKVFGDYAGLAQASQWAQFEALQYEIETIRLHPTIAGYVITEFTDLHWECNGLLDMLRRPKAYYGRLAALNADTVIIPRTPRRACWAGETIIIDLKISHFGRTPIQNASLVGQSSGLSTPTHSLSLESPISSLSIQPAQVIELEPLTITLPSVAQAEQIALAFILQDQANRVITRNSLTLSLFPIPTPAAQVIACPDSALADKLTAAGYTLTNQPTQDIPLILTTLDKEGLRFVEQGGKVLFLAETPEALQTAVPNLELQARHGTPWAGDWASSFAWYRRDVWGKSVPGDGRFDFTFAPIIPETVISSTRLEDFADDVLAGLFVGWLRRPVGLVQRMRMGRGTLLVSTLCLADQVTGNPLAATLFHEYIQMLVAN